VWLYSGGTDARAGDPSTIAGCMTGAWQTTMPFVLGAAMALTAREY